MSDNVCVQICSRKGETLKKKASTPTHLFVGVCVCVYLCVYVLCGCFLPPETLQTAVRLTGSQICIYSRLRICWCFFFPHTSKTTESQLSGKYFFSPFPLETYISKYCISYRCQLFCCLRDGDALSFITALISASGESAPCCLHHLIKY